MATLDSTAATNYNINVDKEYNLLNECKYIRNMDGCVYDTNVGYEVVFRDGLQGWDNLTGWDGHLAPGYFLWGPLTATSGSLSRSSALTIFEADFFSDFEVDMLIRYDENIVGQTFETLTAQLQWKLTVDTDWRDDSIKTFEGYADGVWHRYRINMLEHKNWVGTVENLIFSPVINGAPNIEVLIKRMAFRSDVNYKCSNPACSYSRSYSHPCPAVGTYASAYSTTRKTSVSIDNDHSRVGVSIDNYPVKYIDLDLSHCTDVWTIAQSITMKLNTIGVGGYRFAECHYNEVEDNFRIYSGTRGPSGSVAVYHGGAKDATVSLGFYTDSDTPTYRTTTGEAPADGFSPAYYKLPATLLYRLPAGRSVTIDYDPSSPLTEMGRSDLIGMPVEMLFEESSVIGTIMIDMFGRCSYDGTVDNLRYRGDIIDGYSKIILLRPTSDFSFKVVEIADITSAHNLGGYYYGRPVTWSVRPGDVFGLYMCKAAMHTESGYKARPEQIYKFSWIERREFELEEDLEITFSESDVRFFGYEGLPVYGYSSTKMIDIGIEAELRREYGISQVALLGPADIDTIDIDLMSLDSTLVQVSSAEGSLPMQSATAATYMNEFQDDTESFWIDIWFPGYTKDMYKSKVIFEQSHNVRAFTWEGYIEDEVIQEVALAWGQYYAYPTQARSVGSEKPWMRLPTPTKVILDNVSDKTYDPYLAYNYVTNDSTDRFPALTETEALERARFAEFTRWNVLEQQWEPLHTRGMRFFCWRWADAKIQEIHLWAKLESTETLLHSVDMAGFSGPEVFSTESYDITDITGDSYVSSPISRAETTDYKYGFSFSLQSSGVALAPVGTTLSRFEMIIGDLPARIQQVKLIPQHLAVQVRGEGNEPLAEITDLQWGMPSDGSDYTYGPAKSYQVCNDLGQTADLLVGVADPLAIDQACVFSSSLSDQESLDDPARGISAQLIRAGDYIYTNNKSLNYHAKVYGLIDQTPTAWYSSTTDGAVWQTLTSGTPFPTVIRWNEPIDPYTENWKVFNVAQSEDVSISGGLLSMTVTSRPLNVSMERWDKPTYFYSVGLRSSFTLEAQVPEPLTQEEGVDTSAGLVIFDNLNRSRYIRIDRYSGNDTATMSGYSILSHRASLPFGDYISYGRRADYTTSGIARPIEQCGFPSQPVMLRLRKDATQVSLGWRLSNVTGQFTTVSSFDISTWSDQIRLGLFVDAEDVSGESSDIPITASFDYISYKYNDARTNHTLDYDYDFNDVITQSGRWSALNSDNSEVFRSGPDGLRIKRWVATGAPKVFDSTVETPALSTEWGAPSDYGVVSFKVADYDRAMMSSGIFSAGMLLRDSTDTSKYIKYSVTRGDRLTLDIAGQIDNISLDTPVSNASGIWLKLQKGAGVVVPSYSRNGSSYTSTTGVLIKSWSSADPTELVVSTDIWDVRFKDFYLGTSKRAATHLVAYFDTPFPLGNIFGRQGPWEELMYSDTDFDGFSFVKPDIVSYVKFKKPATVDLDLQAVKFMPEVSKSVENDYQLVTVEIPLANELFYDRTGEARAAINTDAQWPSTVTKQGVPMFEYPTLLVDLGGVYRIGRCPYAVDKTEGRFSASNVNLPVNVEWPENNSGYSGFLEPCALSAGGECTVSKTWDRPRQIYDRYTDVPGYYFPGSCDGMSTEAGDVNRACPMYYRSTARWWLLEHTDYTTTTASAGSVWFIPPVHLHPSDPPLPITNKHSWWSTDYGEMNWVYEQNTTDYALVYSYPGLNIVGSCYFNGYGSPWWRLESDRDWTYNDALSVDLRFYQPENINSLKVRVGRDPYCHWLFTITGSLTESWSTHIMPFGDAELVINKNIGLDEPSYTPNDIEFYGLNDLPYAPMPFISLGYVEIVASGINYSDIYMKNFKHLRQPFSDEGLYLGVNDTLYIPDLDLVNTGTIEFDYYPDKAAMGLVRGDPREFLYSVMTVSNANSGLSVVLNKQWGWNIYAFTPEDKQLYGFLPLLREALLTLPSESSGRKAGPFHIVLSWSPDNIRGLEENIVLWVDGIRVCSGSFSSLGDYLNTDDITITLGRGATVFDAENSDQYAGCAKFFNLKVYKYSTSDPTVDLDTTSLIPENLLELSTLQSGPWYSFTSGNLPIVYPRVPHGECRTFWMRNKRPSNSVKKLHKRHTAYLSVIWEVKGV